MMHVRSSNAEVRLDSRGARPSLAANADDREGLRAVCCAKVNDEDQGSELAVPTNSVDPGLSGPSVACVVPRSTCGCHSIW